MGRPEFPRNLAEFQARFSSEAACRDYLGQCRWPDGYCCPRCGHSGAYLLEARSLRKCRSCGYQVSVTAGTVLHRSHTQLQQWFRAAYLVTTMTPGISALQLQRQLGLGRYETAWTILQKLRRAMVRPERDRLTGTVEVDEAYVGGVEEGRRGGRKKGGKKVIVVGAVEARGKGRGRVRLAIVEDVSAACLVPFVEGAVEKGTTILSDAWQGYAPLKKRGYDHKPETQGNAKNAANLLPRIHLVFSNFKTWLLGTHHGIGHEHMTHYINEFVFRFNRRRTPMAAFQSLLGLTMVHRPTSYQQLYAGESTG